jgi:hypothetical protein
MPPQLYKTSISFLELVFALVLIHDNEDDAADATLCSEEYDIDAVKETGLTGVAEVALGAVELERSVR